jgi:hypothetical protein
LSYGTPGAAMTVSASVRPVSNVVDVLGQAVRGLDACNQDHIDQVMVELDGEADLSRLGANAVVTPPTQWITGAQKGVVSHGDAVPDGDAFRADENFFDHAA